MFLKSLEVRGFKSFADKTELRFKKGVTAVVGPNGSGKSNISDSVRWVLGEQSVKSLRGGKMEDVIFAGTQFRKAVGLAQVSLTLENSDGSLPIEYNEVTVTRRIFRSGETEYLINNQKCRLKDITELFMDTGIGKEGYSIIGQGKIDAILSGKAEERRALFEEAAGIVKFKARKEEAEKKLDNTDNNLVRIRDIIGTYEERLEPLKGEKEKAIKYKDLADELQGKEVSLLVFHINKVKKDIQELSSEISERDNMVTAKKEKLLERKEELKSLEDAIEKLDIKNKVEKDEYYNQKEVIAQNTKEIELFKERIYNFKSLIEKEENEIKDLESKINVSKDEKNRLQLELEEKKLEQAEKEKELVTIESDINSVNRAISNIEKELLALKGDEFEYLSKNSEINNAINSFSKDISHREEKKKILDSSIMNLESNLAINKGTIEEIKGKIVHTKEQIAAEEVEVLELKKILSTNNSKLINKENAIKVVAKNINGSEATYITLSNLEKHYEGYNRTVKNLMEHVQSGRVESVDEIKVLGEIFKVKKEYEVAMEIALGGAISNVITKDEEIAKRLINYLKAKSLGRATFLPLNIIKGRKVEVPNDIKNSSGYIGVASDIISINEEYRGIIEYTLGRTLIALDMDSALNISRVGRHNYKIVTLNGEVINPGGALTGGSIQGKNNNLLGRKRELEELKNNIKKLKEEYNETNTEIEEIKRSIKSIDDKILNKREDIHQKNIDLTVLVGEVGNLISEEEKLNNSIKVTQEEIRVNSKSIENLILVLDKKKNELIVVGEKSSESKERIAILDSEFISKKEELDILKEKSTTVKISQATLDESLQGKKNELISKNNDINEKISKVNYLLKEIQYKTENILSLDNSIQEKEQSINEIINRIKALEEIFKEDEIKKTTIKETYRSKEGLTNEIVEIIRIEENELNKRAIQNARLESERESLFNKLNTELNLTLAEALEIAVPIENYQGVKDEISKLKGKISVLGTVNLSAIVEYDEVLEKYEFMSTQELDLQKAKDELIEVIGEMTEKMQSMFRENFKILNENFSETFRELFKGGTAELILGDGDELNANIVINVQPPGKKLQNINLMSGGEKVLSAIALLFAILKMKPTPFCILDEIEAALDDANVFRYAEFLKKFSKDIQFIVITHRKGTMEACDVMYGVTMEEKGISKVVSVDLSDS